MLKRKSVQNFIISAIITCVMFVLYRVYTDFIYLTNDDMYLQAIVSGEISGRPDAHMIYSNYILGLILSALYRMIPTIPWYGLYLVGSLALCFCLLLHRCISFAEKKSAKITISIGFVVVMTFVMFRHIAMVQYTVVSAVVGATAIFLAVTMDMAQDSKRYLRQLILIFLLAALSFLIRDKAFLMLVPFAACGWIGKWILEKDKTKQIHLRFVSLLLGIGFLILLLGGIDMLAYRGNSQTQKDWTNFLKYNQSREQLYDYYGFPDYENNQELYDSLQINRESYEAAYYHYMLLNQEQYNAETMTSLAEVAKEEVNSNKMSAGIVSRIVQVLKDFVERNLSYTDRPMNIVVYGAWFCVGILLLVTRSKKILVRSVLLFITRMGIWIYIIWQGRYPDRITQGLYFVELLMLLAICFECGWKERKLQYAIMVLFILCIPAIYLGVPKMQAVKGENAGKLFFGTSYGQLKEYCVQNSDNLYLVDMNSISSFNSSVFEGVQENRDCDNLLPMGSWLPKSPLTEETLNRYQISSLDIDLIDCDNLYFVFKDSDATTTEYLVNYYNSIMENIECVRVDTLHTDAGIDYGIWKLVGGFD